MLEKILLKALLRQLIITNISTEKPRGAIIHVELNPEYTKFNINDYIKLSKKIRRSEKLVDIEKAILQYCMSGKCISFRKRGINTSFIIRNVLTLCPFEATYMLFAPNIEAYSPEQLSLYIPLSKYERRTNYELRKRPPVKSKSHFVFVVGQVDTLFIEEDDYAFFEVGEFKPFSASENDV